MRDLLHHLVTVHRLGMCGYARGGSGRRLKLPEESTCLADGVPSGTRTAGGKKRSHSQFLEISELESGIDGGPMRAVSVTSLTISCATDGPCSDKV